MTQPSAPLSPPEPPLAGAARSVREGLGTRSIVLIGMMGAGKSSVGRRLGKVLDLPFLDADTEIEKAAGMSIPEIFSRHGEAYFRAGETRVVGRLLDDGGTVIATGGGAWMNPLTREHARRCGVSVWLKADFEVLLRRVRKRGGRPLLKDNPEETLRRLLTEREPVYAEADILVRSREVPHETMVSETLGALDAFFRKPTP